MTKRKEIFDQWLFWILLLIPIALCNTSSIQNESTKDASKCPSNCWCMGEYNKCVYDDSTKQDISLKLSETLKFLYIDILQPDRFNATAQLNHLTNLKRLKIKIPKSKDFPMLPHLQSLQYLDLSNNFLTRFSSNAFVNNLHIAHLNLSYNDLNLSHLFIDNFSSLKHLDLSHNIKIGQSQHEVLFNKLQLEELNLSNTSLKIFSPIWAAQMMKLKYLNVSYNSINILSRFVNMPELQTLDISHNPLRALPSLKNFPRLANLLASNTFVSYLKTTEMIGCNLTKLYLSSSKITNINEGLLKECKFLKVLDLSSNHDLWRLEHGALYGLPFLQTLHLNNCPNLAELEDDVFNGLENLQYLDLQYSEIRVLPKSIGSLRSLTALNLENTQILCDCHAYWFTEFYSILNRTLTKNKIHCADGIKRSVFEIIKRTYSLNCNPVNVLSEPNKWTLSRWGENANLECKVMGNPEPQIVWQAVDYQLYINNEYVQPDYWLINQISEALREASYTPNGKYAVLSSGNLLIRNVTREDTGRYKCFAFNPVSNASIEVFLGLDDEEFRHIIIESILMGLSSAATFLLITLLVQLLKYVMIRFGWICCCCEKRIAKRARQIKEVIDTLENYRSSQLEKLKENYTSQVVYIKDSCYLQMEKLRESYSQQSKNLRDLCDYSSQQLTGIRDQYLDQVNKISEYSMSQMNRVRTNYVFQRHRIRKFSGHQMLRLRETYKYQQKTLNKLLENLPDLYIQACRTGSCQRTDSVVFDEIDGLDIYYKVDFLHPDNESFSSECYYTPNSTLTRKLKRPSKKISRNTSLTSTDSDFPEAVQVWLTPRGSLTSEDSSLQKSYVNKITDNRVSDIKNRHRRCYSASVAPQLIQLFLPKSIVIEENTDNPLIKPNNDHSSSDQHEKQALLQDYIENNKLQDINVIPEFNQNKVDKDIPHDVELAYSEENKLFSSNNYNLNKPSCTITHETSI